MDGWNEIPLRKYYLLGVGVQTVASWIGRYLTVPYADQCQEVFDGSKDLRDSSASTPGSEHPSSSCSKTLGRTLFKGMRVCKADSHFLEEIDNYTELSYLRKSQIIHIYCRFKELGDEVTTDLHHRFEKSKILQVFPELSFNPFVDRLFHVFSSLKDGKMSFEDVLDLASVFSEDCPIDVKAQWAFLMFDFDGDQLLNQDDIAEIVTRLTKSSENTNEDVSHSLTDDETRKVAEIILNDIVLCHSEGITCMEFTNEVKKNPEFECSFRIKFL